MACHLERFGGDPKNLPRLQAQDTPVLETLTLTLACLSAGLLSAGMACRAHHLRVHLTRYPGGVDEAPMLLVPGNAGGEGVGSMGAQ